MNVFGLEHPAVYDYDTIYRLSDGAVETAVNAGKFIPAVKSVVVQKLTTGEYYLYVVSAVDEVTKESTLSPFTSVALDNDNARIIDYGNDNFMLFFDNQVEQKRLVVDSKLSFFGSNLTEYKLVILDEQGERTVISQKFDSEGNYETDRIDIVTDPINNIKKCNNCYTDHILSDGDSVIMEVYDASGILAARLSLVAKEALILNDFESSSDPIVAFRATCNQVDGANWVIYSNQGINDLNIFPEVVFASGKTAQVPIDNASCFIYGMDDVESSVAGLTYPIIIKYFLADSVTSEISEGTDNRFLLLEKTIIVKERPANAISKISPLPRWDSLVSRWYVDYFAFYDDRATSSAVIPTYETVEFDGDAFGTWQELTINSSYLDAAGTPVGYQQDYVVKLGQPTDQEPFLIAEALNDDTVYGLDNATRNKPTIQYDAALEQYFIPTSDFADSDAFLNNFFWPAAPPFDSETETESPIPTHYTLRDASTGRVLVAGNIAIESYATPATLLHVVSVNEFVGKTIMVEFLLEVAGEYQRLYGVPVLVGTGTYNE